MERTDPPAAETVRVVRHLNKLYLKTPSGEMQVGLLSGQMVMWVDGRETVWVCPACRDDDHEVCERHVWAAPVYGVSCGCTHFDGSSDAE
jgi:hypothetical protein